MAFVKNLDKFIHRRPRPKVVFRRLQLERGLRILPNLFTLGNALFGFYSIIFAAYGDFIAAAYFILLGALMDALDGRIARYAHVTSELGLQLDSLCDGISFCLAPAVLAYLWKLKYMGEIGFVACALFCLMGLLRLARFNLTQSQQSIAFRGAPTPLAGCFIATVLLNTRSMVFSPMHLIILLTLVIFLAFLMVSNVPFPTFKHLRKNTYALALFAFTAVFITLGLVKVLFIVLVSYIILSFGQFLYSKVK
jgi:CDP-diacylglycerol--serine O-phosphatidyltransferase